MPKPLNWVTRRLSPPQRDLLSPPGRARIELVVECRIDRVGRTDDEQRTAVWGRTRGRLDGDIAAGPGPVVDDELLAESF